VIFKVIAAANKEKSVQRVRYLLTMV